MPKPKLPPIGARYVSWYQLCTILGAFFAFYIGITLTAYHRFEDEVKNRIDRIETRSMHSETELKNDMRSFQEGIMVLLDLKPLTSTTEELEDENIQNTRR